MTDLLDIDLATVDTNFPVVAGPVMLDLLVSKSEVMTNDAQTWKLELTTTGPTQSTKGDTLNAGIKIFHTANLAATGKATPDMVAKRAGELIQGGLPFKNIREILANPALAQGKTLRCRVGVEAEGTGKDGVWRGTRNNILAVEKRS
jgi:hypothetical protein